MKPVAIFRFSPTEGPGHFGEWLDARGIPWKLIALDRGDAVPADPRAFAGIGMMGGPMSANDDLPWNAPLLALVRDAVGADVPVIGHCLGGQLARQGAGSRGRAHRDAGDRLGRCARDRTRCAHAWFGGRDRSRPSSGTTTSSGCRGRRARADQRASIPSRRTPSAGTSASSATSR